jgi:hypothetical protein
MEKLTKDTQISSKENFGDEKQMCRKNGLRKWNNNLAQIINDKIEALKKSLSTEIKPDKIKYNRYRAIAKTAACQNRHKTWNNFVNEAGTPYNKTETKSL